LHLRQKTRMENPYDRAPLQVTLVNVETGDPVRSYVYLGSAPSNVLSAANRGTVKTAHRGRVLMKPGRTSAWPTTEWPKKDAKTLFRHYGPRWRQILTPRVGAVLAGLKEDPGKTGGVEGPSVDFGGLDDFDDEDIIIREESLDDSPEALSKLPGAREVAPAKELGWDPHTVYSPIAVYPEDTFADLKIKIYAATRIPPYRQHLFYVAGDKDDDSNEYPVRTTYRVTVEGGLILTDVRQLSHRRPGDNVAGIPVDKRLEERKEDMRVDALDSFRLLEETPGSYVRRVYVADLAPLLYSKIESLKKAISDKYQFDLLYYGLILKYWPSLSPEAFRMAVSNPNELPSTYPLLSPPLDKVRSQLQIQQRLIDRTYAYSKMVETRYKHGKARKSLAVTEALVRVDPRAAKMPVNVRNVFDWLATSPRVPAAIARVTPEMMGSQGRARRDYILRKTHVTAAAPAVKASLEKFLSRPPKRPGVSYAITRDAPAFPGQRKMRALRFRAFSQPQFVFLTLYSDGRYTIKSSWREDDRIGFEEVVKHLSDAARVIVDPVNEMGAAGLPLGGTLETPASASKGIHQRITISGLTASSFWPQALTSVGFREMKTRWREYEKAGIVGIRGLQQSGAYTFLFRKGVVDYDPRAMEKIVTRGDARGVGRRQVVVNHYAHLTDPEMAQRWQYVYSGRLVRIYHRTADLRIEMVDVNMEEFRRIHLYVYVFLYSLAHGPDRLTKGLLRPGQVREIEGRLRSLQEQDPDLYDLKKYDEGATVYSVLCQGDRQPQIVPQQSLAGLSAKERKGLVEYWNFTRGEKAYYRCPSKRYPHLSFRAGEHPLGYCLPCCKKTKPLPGSRSEAVNTLCVSNHIVSESEASTAGEDAHSASRHVLSYGKPIPVGRISHAPQLLVGGLLYDTIPRKFKYRLVGVSQTALDLPGAGYFYSLAASLSLDPASYVRELADTVLAIGGTYHSLASGCGALFGSAAELAQEIVETFLASPEHNANFSHFGPGGKAEHCWREIVTDLTRIRFDIDVVRFIDGSGDGNVVLEVDPVTVSRLTASRGKRPAPIDIAILLQTPAGTYPLVAMDQREFVRRAQGRGPARRFFSNEYAEGEVKDTVVDIVRKMVKTATEPDRAGGFGLEFVRALCREKGYRLAYKLVNLRDMCYGVLIEVPKIPGAVYFPVPYTPHYLEEASEASGEISPALFGPRPDKKYPAATLARVLKAANSASKKGKMRPSVCLTAENNMVVGFIAEEAGSKGGGSSGIGLYFHHDPVPLSNAGALPWTKAPKSKVPYSMRDIDSSIYSSGGFPSKEPLPKEKKGLAGKGLRKNRSYRLFLAEFAALLQTERNHALRAQIKALFNQTRFTSPASLAQFRRALSKTLADFPEDAEVIRRMVAGSYAKVGPVKMRKLLSENFAATLFDFDRKTLRRLRGLPFDQVKIEVEKLMRAQVELEKSKAAPNARVVGTGGPEPFALQNMYVACSLPSSLKRPQCIRRRLKMTDAAFRDYVSVLAADVLNPFKTATLGSLAAGVVDGFRFIVRPGEQVSIR
jgi:hypothetical protein